MNGLMTVCAKSLAAKRGLPLGIAAYGTGAGDTLGQMHTGQDGANCSLFVTNNARGITCCRILVVLFVLRRGARDVNAAHRVMVRFVIVVKSWSHRGLGVGFRISFTQNLNQKPCRNGHGVLLFEIWKRMSLRDGLTSHIPIIFYDEIDFVRKLSSVPIFGLWDE
eukprot:scaffold15694_cov104-Amphora_coffeaeformis.AAC.1